MSGRGRILVVDDEVNMARAVAVALERSGYDCRVCHDGKEALASFRREAADVVVTDRRMPRMDGDELLQRLLEIDPKLPVILVTAYADVTSAVGAMKAGAFDYVAKPFDNDELRSIVARALEIRRLERDNRRLRAELVASGDAPIVAESSQMKAVLDLVDRIAPTRSTVLIQGETGTGKELLARRLHYGSDRALKPFVAVNCKAYAETLLESELFGHEKGSFTGADRDRLGCFERAHDSTLFLDEIAEVSAGFQAKILRVLQEGEVQRVGSEETRSVDFRLVSATNTPLEAETREGRFREDLFFRLNVIPVSVPPLRERRDDILPLARHFAARQSSENGRPLELSKEAEKDLLQHSWPGNVRELENAIERASILTVDGVLRPDDLLLASEAQRTPTESGGTLQDRLSAATRNHVKSALEATGGRRAEAAARLGIDRTTLYRLMQRHDL